MFHEGAISLLKAQYQNGRIVHGGKKVEEKKKKKTGKMHRQNTRNTKYNAWRNYFWVGSSVTGCVARSHTNTKMKVNRKSLINPH